MDGFDEFFATYDHSQRPPYDWKADSRDGELTVDPAQDGCDELTLSDANTSEFIIEDAHEDCAGWLRTLQEVREL